MCLFGIRIKLADKSLHDSRSGHRKLLLRKRSCPSAGDSPLSYVAVIDWDNGSIVSRTASGVGERLDSTRNKAARHLRRIKSYSRIRLHSSGEWMTLKDWLHLL